MITGLLLPLQETYENLVATSNPKKNGFSSPLSWRAQAYKMEVEEGRDTKRKKVMKD